MRKFDDEYRCCHSRLGPYGLSLAAHLKCVGVEHRIFGEPMQFWRENVPPGMLLKSVGSSSDLLDPGSRFTIADFYAEQKLAFAEKAVLPSDASSNTEKRSSSASYPTSTPGESPRWLAMATALNCVSKTARRFVQSAS